MHLKSVSVFYPLQCMHCQVKVRLQKKVEVFVDDLWRLSFHFHLPANIAISAHLQVV